MDKVEQREAVIEEGLNTGDTLQTSGARPPHQGKREEGIKPVVESAAQNRKVATTAARMQAERREETRKDTESKKKEAQRKTRN